MVGSMGVVQGKMLIIIVCSVTGSTGSSVGASAKGSVSSSVGENGR